MALSIAFDGNLTIQLSPEARPMPVPVKFALTYTRKAMHDFVHAGAVSNVAVGQGSVTAPKFVLIWVREGSVDFSWASNGAAPTTISANPDPPPDDAPVLVMMRWNPGASQLYMTTAGPATGAVWVFS